MDSNFARSKQGINYRSISHDRFFFLRLFFCCCFILPAEHQKFKKINMHQEKSARTARWKYCTTPQQKKKDLLSYCRWDGCSGAFALDLYTVCLFTSIPYIENSLVTRQVTRLCAVDLIRSRMQKSWLSENHHIHTACVTAPPNSRIATLRWGGRFLWQTFVKLAKILLASVKCEFR